MSQQLQTQVNIAPAPKPSFTAAQSGSLQRKCACGGAQGLAGDCKECGKNRLTLQRFSANRAEPSNLPRALAESSNPGSRASVEVGPGHDFSRVQVHARAPHSIQTQLAVSQPGDQSEQEADRIAEQVTGVRAPSGPEANRPSTDLSQAQPLNQGRAGDEIADTSGAAPATSSAETAALEETPAAGLIVEDDAREVGPGQMRKNEFLDELRTAICAAADAELASVGRSTEGCPYIEQWIGFYRARGSQHVERSLRRYAPEAAGMRMAREYIPLVSERVRRAVTTWARTGEITGVPEELASQARGGGLLQAAGGLISGIATSLSGIASGVGSVVSGIGGLFFKAKAGGAREADPHSIKARLDSGQSLRSDVRTRMESAFGHDFSGVRVHTDTRAAELNTALNARAFTIGEHVAFGAGEYQPGTLIGAALIAHELAHVVQQQATGRSIRSEPSGGAAAEALETDADRSALHAVASGWQNAVGAASTLARKAMPRLRSGISLQRCARNEGGATTTPRGTGACPSTITTDTTLTSDCNNGISVGADNITLDCAGHIITGAGGASGIELRGRTGVTVNNCRVTNFGNGFALRNSPANTFTNNSSFENIVDGFDINDSDGNTFIQNSCSRNRDHGIELDGSEDNLFTRNTVSGNVDGFDTEGPPRPGAPAPRNTFENNIADGNQGSGFRILSNDNTIRGNSSANSTEAGFRIQGDANNLSGNTGGNNTEDGFRIQGNANNLRDNVGNANQRDGFRIEGNDNILGGNSGSGNRSDDLDVRNGTTGNTCTGNTFGNTNGRCPPDFP